jgi:hypothetical protein
MELEVPEAVGSLVLLVECATRYWTFSICAQKGTNRQCLRPARRRVLTNDDLQQTDAVSSGNIVAYA